MIGERPKDANPRDRIFAEMQESSGLNVRLKRIAEAVGITKNLHFHIARHTFAVLSLNKGLDIYSVSNILGHTNLKTTLIYAKMTNEKIYKALDILNED